ncbi:MAG: SGNH/GDSL hydrolase family protein [Phycisphaerae bacterium]
MNKLRIQLLICLLAILFATGAAISEGAARALPAAAPDNNQDPLTPSQAPKLPVNVSPYNKNILYVGRFDKSMPEGPRCAWPASSVTIRFRGTAANVEMAGGNTDYWQIVVDGHPTFRLQLAKHPALYCVASGLRPGTHEVTLVKLGEALFGTAQILGFELSAGGVVLPVAPSHRRLEVIGDSISAGFGNEAVNQYAKFSAQTENAYMAYGAIAARRLHAEYVCIAWSGKCLWPHNTIPAIYGRTLPEQVGSKWNFSAWQPQAVVINLGTNDFAGGDPNEQKWVAAYVRFIQRIRRNYPGVSIICALSSMVSNAWLPKKNARSMCRRYIRTVVKQCHRDGYKKVFFLAFPLQNGQYGFGAQWHPSVREDRYLAGILVKALRDKLGW